MTRLTVTARIHNGPTSLVVSASGQTGRTLVALVEAGAGGVTAQEVSSWALRLAAYCFELRHRYGLEIRTDREAHPFGWHGRHVLVTPVEIVEIDDKLAA